MTYQSVSRFQSSHLINKLTSVFYACFPLLMINCVITLSKWLWNHQPQANGSAVNFDNVMAKFIVNKRTDAKKTDVNLLIICDDWNLKTD